MAFDTTTKQVLLSGANMMVRVGASAVSNSVVGLVSNVSFNENFQLQKANCLGKLGPVSIDPQDYSCEITIGAFVPKSDLPETGQVNIAASVPLRGNALADGAKFAYLDFYDDTNILAAFSGVIVASSGVQIEGGGYIRRNVQLQALERI